MEASVTYGGMSVPSGKKRAQYITMPGTDYRLPLTIVNGKRDGRKILITASIHGFEYPGILSAAELSQELDPAEVSGAVIIIPVVNASGFYGRQTYVCPDDEERKNLNRLAPGNPEGTFGERLIAYLYAEFVSRVDFHIDLHSGDATEDLISFAAAGNSPDPDTRAYVYEAIHHTDYPYYTQSSGSGEFYNGSAIYHHIPSMMFEVGGAGMWTRDQADREKENLRRIARFLGILPGEAPYNETQVQLTRQSWIGAEATGFFYPLVTIGDMIREGQKLYEIRDVFGHLLAEHYARHDGKVMILARTLGISKGDDTIFYGRE